MSTRRKRAVSNDYEDVYGEYDVEEYVPSVVLTPNTKRKYILHASLNDGSPPSPLNDSLLLDDEDRTSPVYLDDEEDFPSLSHFLNVSEPDQIEDEMFVMDDTPPSPPSLFLLQSLHFYW